jgi:hypothetical protein
MIASLSAASVRNRTLKGELFPSTSFSRLFYFLASMYLPILFFSVSYWTPGFVFLCDAIFNASIICIRLLGLQVPEMPAASETGLLSREEQAWSSNQGAYSHLTLAQWNVHLFKETWLLNFFYNRVLVFQMQCCVCCSWSNRLWQLVGQFLWKNWVFKPVNAMQDEESC